MVKRPAKANMGRQKIEIAKIAKRNHLHVTFSKRRSGLFKKASELCTLCGAEVAIVVFSPSGKVFSFGHPDVDSLIDRFLSRDPNILSRGCRGGGAARHAAAGEAHLNVQLMEASARLEEEKERSAVLREAREIGRSEFWWEAPVEELGLCELQQLRVHLEELKKNVVMQADRISEAMNDNTMPFSADVSSDTTSYGCKSMELNFNLGYGHGLF